MNSWKKIILLFGLLCLFFISFVSAIQTQTIFTENFGNSNFFVGSSYCENQPYTNWTLENSANSPVWNVTFDNDVFCFVTSNNNRYFEQQNTSGRYKTAYGITNKRTFGTNAELFGIGVILDRILSLTSDSQISYYRYDADSPEFLSLWNNNELLITISLTTSCSAGTPNKCCEIYNAYNDSSYDTFNMQQVYDNCTGYSDVNFTDITHIFFVSAYNGLSAPRNEMNLDDITIYFLNGTNELPDFNVTMDKNYFCINDTDSNIQLNYTINVSDYENDTIYYSIKADEEDLFTVGSFNNLKFTNRVCRFNPVFLGVNYIGILYNYLFNSNNVWYCSEDENFFSGININYISPEFDTLNNSCEISNYINLSNFYIDTFTDVNGNLEDMLILNPLCDNNKEAYLKTDFNIKNTFFSNNIYLTDNINNTFYITFYQNPLLSEIITKIKFIQNETNNLAVFNINESGEFHITDLNITNADVGFFNYIAVDYSYSADTNLYNLTISTIDKNSTITNIKGYSDNSLNYLTKYIGWSIENDTLNFMYIENFLYGGFTLTPEWTLQKPNNVTIIGDGLKSLHFYITDNIHLNKDFVYKTEYINIESGDVCIDRENLLDTTTSGGLSALGGLFYDFCGALDGLGSVFGLTISFCKIIMWFYIIFSIVISFGTIAIFSRFLGLDIGISTGGFMFTFFGFLGSFIFNMERGLLFLFVFIGAIAFLNLMRAFLFGNTTGGNNV